MSSSPGAVPITCTLTGQAQTERVHRWRELLAHATGRQRIDGGLRFVLPATLAGELAGLAAAEQSCCGFFDFTLRPTGGGPHFEVRTPEEAAPLLTEVFGAADRQRAAVPVPGVRGISGAKKPQ